TRQEIEEKVSLEASRVPFLRRVFAYVIDYNLIAIVIRISIFFMDLNKYTLNLLVALVLAFIYFIFKGKSVGLKLMNLKISSTTNEKLALTQSLKRSLLYTISYNLIFLISLDFFNYLNNIEKDIRYILLFYIILMFVSQFIMILHVFHNAILKKTPLF